MWCLECFVAFLESCFVGCAPTACNCNCTLGRVCNSVLGNGIVVCEICIFVDAEHRQQSTVQRLLVHAADRSNRRLTPHRVSSLSTCEVGIVRLEHRDWYAEACADLLDDVITTRQILARKVQRHQLDVAADRHHASALACPLVQRPHRLLEPPHRCLACATLYNGCVVGTAHVLEERQILNVRCLRLLDCSVCSLHLAESVVKVARVWSLEVDDLVEFESLHCVSINAVQVRLDQFSLARQDRDILRRDGEQFRWHAQSLVHHDMQIRIAAQLHVEHAHHALREAVLVLIRLAQQLKDRMRINDLFEIACSCCGLHDARRWLALAVSE